MEKYRNERHANLAEITTLRRSNERLQANLQKETTTDLGKAICKSVLATNNKRLTWLLKRNQEIETVFPNLATPTQGG